MGLREIYRRRASGGVVLPTLVSAVIYTDTPTEIVMVWSEAITGTNLGFTISGTTSTTFSSISGSGTTTIIGVMANAAVVTETVLLNYDSGTGDLENGSAVAVGTFTNYPVYQPLNDINSIYSLKKYFNWSNAVIQVRRSSDNTLATVFFDGASPYDTITLNSYISATSSTTTPDATTLGTWVGSNNAFVRIWAAQSPNDVYGTELSVSQSSSDSRQPAFITSGVIETKNGKPCMVLDGDAFLEINDFNPVVSKTNDFTILTVSTNDISDNLACVYNNTVGATNGITVYQDSRSSVAKRVASVFSSSYVNLLEYRDIPIQKLITLTSNWDSINTNYSGYYNDVLQETNSTTGDFANEYIRIGRYVNTDSKYLTGTVQELMFFSADKTNNISVLHGEVNTYYDIYPADQSPPNAVDDLALTTAYGSALEVGWTAPTSTNAILFYRVYVDGVFDQDVTGLTATILGLSLSTSYDITVVVYDEYYIYSGVSNTLTQSTNATYTIPTGNIISYWDFDTDSLDQVGTNDGTDTSISYVASGGIGNVADFTASTSAKIQIADDDSLTFGNGSTDSPFSISFRVKWNATPASTVFINKKDTTTGIDGEYQISWQGTYIEFLLLDNGFTDSIRLHSNWTPLVSTWYNLLCTYDGSGSISGLKTYVNNVLLSSFDGSTGSYIAMENETTPLIFGKNAHTTTRSLNGYMDEVAIFDKELSTIDISEIYNKNQAGLYLTE